MAVLLTQFLDSLVKFVSQLSDFAVKSVSKMDMDLEAELQKLIYECAHTEMGENQMCTVEQRNNVLKLSMKL